MEQLNMADVKTDKPIPQLALPEQGLNQDQRLLQGLESDYVQFDERDQEDSFTFLKGLASHFKFYSSNDHTADNNWSAFFPFESGQAEAWLQQHNGHIAPQLALLKVFLEAYHQGPQVKLNALKQRYLDYYYQDVLNFRRSASQPDRAHLVLTPKKQVASVLITPEHQLLAGKRPDKSEILVQPVEESLVNQSLVVVKRSIFRSQQQPGVIKIAPVADSLDGVGEPFEDQPKWFGFGHEALPACDIGFALSSRLLLLSEAKRQIDIVLTLTEPLVSADTALSELFKIYLSTSDGWSEERFADADLSGKEIRISTTIAEDEPAIVPYEQKLHGFQLDTQDPVIQLLINKDSGHSLTARLFDAKIASAKLSVKVTGMRNLVLTSDNGRVNPDNDFLPFGPAPKIGSTLSISSDEVFSKRLKSVSVNLSWKNPPVNFSNHYSGYGSYVGMPGNLNNSYFTVDAKVRDGSGRNFSNSNQPLFHSTNAAVSIIIDVPETGGVSAKLLGRKDFAKTLVRYQSNWARKEFGTFTRINPVFQSFDLSAAKAKAFAAAALVNRNNGLKLVLKQDFFHQSYSSAYVKNVLALNSDPTLALIAEPYTPEITALSLDYEAYSDTVPLSDSSSQAFANSDIGFFHLDCFGQRREHGYQRQQLDFVTDKRVSLLPEHQEQGALLLGLTGLQAGDSCQLLFQVVDGSSDPNLTPEDIQWSVLCDNYWKPLSHQQLIFDRSNGLLTSGIVKVVIPKQASTENSLMPSGLLWLKLAISNNVESVCQLRNVLSNAIEVVAIPGQDTESFDPLPAGTISKFKTPITEIKSVDQPYDGFGGKAKESTSNFASRVSERLRHKDRALGIRDYETLVLEHFSQIYRVKAIPHCRPVGDSFRWQAPGHVTLLLVPYVSADNAVDPFKPLATSQVIDQVGDLLNQRRAMQAQIHVINPQYLQVRLSLQVRFKTGYEFNFYRDQLQQALQTYLSPWLTDNSAGPEFGGRIYKSVVMDFIDELPYVEFISDVLLQASVDGVTFGVDSQQLQPYTPVQILTTAAEHLIQEATDE